jgi:hypothetical protein
MIDHPRFLARGLANSITVSTGIRPRGMWKKPTVASLPYTGRHWGQSHRRMAADWRSSAGSVPEGSGLSLNFLAAIFRLYKRNPSRVNPFVTLQSRYNYSPLFSTTFSTRRLRAPLQQQLPPFAVVPCAFNEVPVPNIRKTQFAKFGGNGICATPRVDKSASAAPRYTVKYSSGDILDPLKNGIAPHKLWMPEANKLTGANGVDLSLFYRVIVVVNGDVDNAGHVMAMGGRRAYGTSHHECGDVWDVKGCQNVR